MRRSHEEIKELVAARCQDFIEGQCQRGCTAGVTQGTGRGCRRAQVVVVAGTIREAQEDQMNRIRWAAWGVVNIEALERMQRRNYIRAARVEAAELGISLVSGGSKTQPYYQFILAPTPEGHVQKHASAGKDAFRNVCRWLLQMLGEGDERSADGGLWSTGDEASTVSSHGGKSTSRGP